MKRLTIKFTCLLLLLITASFTVRADDEKAPAKLRLSYIKHMDGNTEIRAHAYVKKGKEMEHCAGIDFGFYTDADYEQLFKKLPADDMGMASLILSGTEATRFKDSTGHYHVYCRIEKNSKYKSQEADVSALNASLSVTFSQPSDTEKVLHAVLTVYDEKTGKMIPGVKMPLKCFVKRSLCSLPVGEDNIYTDSTGSISVNFPNDIPGTSTGAITIIVKLDEDDTYGSVVFEKEQLWGKKLVAAENPIANRSVIGARNNAPWFMVIVINAILITIWGYLIYVAYGLYKIKQLGETK